MDRLVYCPDDSHLEDALSVAKEATLAVQIGDSWRTQHLDFDRTKVSVIRIPVYKQFFLETPSATDYGFSILFEYINDFEDVADCKLKVTHDGDVMHSTSMKRDKHSLICSFIPTKSGTYQFVIFKGQVEMDSLTLDF